MLLLLSNSVAGSITGTFAATDPADTSDISGGIVATGTIAANDPDDTESFSGGIVGTGTIAANDPADTADFSGGILATIGTFAAQDPADTPSFSGVLITTGTIAANDPADTPSFSGGIFATGTIAANDPADTPSISGTAAWVATIAANDPADTISFSGAAYTIGTIAANDPADTISFSGSVSINGTFTAQDPADTPSIAGVVVTVGTIAAQDPADTASISASIPAIGTIAAQDPADTIYFSGEYSSDAQIFAPTAKNNLIPPTTPNLPVAPKDWDTRFQDQLGNVLRLYFNQVSGQLQQLSQPQGGQFLNMPYGAFLDKTTQTAANTTTAYVMAMNTTTLSNGVSIRNNSEIVVNAGGTYNLQTSIQLANYDNAPQDIDIWIRRNGSDFPSSNSRIGLAARKSVGDPYHTIFAINFLLALNPGDYVQFVWSTTSVNAYIEAYGAGNTPSRPAVPSVITTMTYVSS